MAASASPSSPCPGALPRWVRDMLGLVPKTSTCVVSVSQGEFVVKVHPATPLRHAPLQPHQQSAAVSTRRAAREGGQQTRARNARQLRSASRAKEHAAKRRSSRLHLQGLLHRHLWRQRGWQRMQAAGTCTSTASTCRSTTPVSRRATESRGARSRGRSSGDGVGPARCAGVLSH